LGSHHFNLQKDGRRGTASCHQALELCTCLEHSTPIAALLSKKFLPVMIEQATTLTPAPLPHDSESFDGPGCSLAFAQVSVRPRDRGMTAPQIGGQPDASPARYISLRSVRRYQAEVGRETAATRRVARKARRILARSLPKNWHRPSPSPRTEKRKKMAKRQARAKQLVNKALSNDPNAAALVLDQIWRSEALGSPAQQAAMNMTEQKFA
jgi:hypothetical protein